MKKLHWKQKGYTTKQKPSPPPVDLKREIAAFMLRNGLKKIEDHFERDDIYKSCRFFPVIQVYTGLDPWPSLWYGVLFDANTSTGRFIQAKTHEELLTKFEKSWFLRKEPNKEKDPVTLVEVWM